MEPNVRRRNFAETLPLFTVNCTANGLFRFSSRESSFNTAPGQLRCFKEVVEDLGGDPGVIMEACGLGPDFIQNPFAAVPFRKFVNVLETAASMLGRSDFGMHLATEQAAQSVSEPLDVALVNARTVCDALRFVADNIRGFNPGIRMRFHEQPCEIPPSLRLHIPLSCVRRQSQAVERIAVFISRALRGLATKQPLIRGIWFTHMPLSDASVYYSKLGIIPQFGKPFNGVIFHHSDLELPLKGSSLEAFYAATDQMEQCFPVREEDIETLVRVHIQDNLFIGVCSIESIATMLGVKPRTLQRILHKCGTTFEEIRDDVRKDIIVRYLGEKRLSLMEVALLSGYSESSALSRVCKHLFGLSPRSLRELLT